MNKLIATNPGGHPLLLEDLAFIGDAYAESFAGLVKTLLGDRFGAVLSGCEQYMNSATGTLWITRGYVAINSALFQPEIFYVAEHDLGFSAFYHTPKWHITDDGVYPDPVTYANLAQRSVHRQRRLTIVDSNTFTFMPTLADTPRYDQIVLENLQAVSSPWLEPTLAAGVTNVGGINPAAYCIDFAKTVFLRGLVQITSGIDPDPKTLFDTPLPTGARPQFPCRFPVYFKSGGGYISTFADTEVFSILIDPDGNVTLMKTNPLLSPITIDLSSISFKAA